MVPNRIRPDAFEIRHRFVEHLAAADRDAQAIATNATDHGNGNISFGRQRLQLSGSGSINGNNDA